MYSCNSVTCVWKAMQEAHHSSTYLCLSAYFFHKGAANSRQEVSSLLPLASAHLSRFPSQKVLPKSCVGMTVFTT